jgi:hypothetical protein
MGLKHEAKPGTTIQANGVTVTVLRGWPFRRETHRYFLANRSSGFPPPPIASNLWSVRQQSTKAPTAKGLSVKQDPKKSDERPKRRVRRYSVNRLLRKKIMVDAAAAVSTEKHRGQMMVRFEQPVLPS